MANTTKKLLSVLLTVSLLLGMMAGSVFTARADGAEDWECNEGVGPVTGNETDGFNFSGSGDLFANYQKKFDPEKTKLEFEFDVTTGEWFYISMYGNDDVITNFLPSMADMNQRGEAAFLFEVKMDQGVKKIVASKWYGTGQIHLYSGYYLPVPVEGKHTIEFVNFCGNWYMVFDDIMLDYDQLNDVFPSVIENDVKFRFGCRAGADFSVTDLKFLPKREEWNASSQTAITENKDGTISIKGRQGGDGVALYNQPANLHETKLQFKGGVLLNEHWSSFGLYTTNIWGGGKLDNALGVPFTLRQPSSGKLNVAYFNGAAELSLTGDIDFDYNVPHTIGFSHDMAGDRWYLAIDDALYFRQEMSDKLKSMASQTLYYWLGAGSDAASDKTFTDVKVVEKEVNWAGSNSAISGNDTVGHSFTATVNDGRASYQKPFNMRTDEISFKFNCAVGSWNYIGFSNGPDNAGLSSQNSTDRFGFMIHHQSDGQLAVVINIGWFPTEFTIPNFDWNAVHTMSFMALYHEGKGHEEWILVLDGQRINTDYYGWLGASYDNRTITLGSQLSGDGFSNMKVGEAPQWVTQETAVTGNSADGFALVGTRTVPDWGNALYRQPVDITTQSLTMQFNQLSSSEWAWLGLHDYCKTIGPLNAPTSGSGPTFELIMSQQGANGKDFQVSRWTGANESPLLYLNDFDYAKPHEFSFVQDGAAWYLRIDNAISTVDIAQWISFVSDEAFLNLGLWKANGAGSLTGIKIGPVSPLLNAEITSTQLAVDENKIISNISVGSDIASLKASLNSNGYTVKVFKSDAEQTSGPVGTGMKLRLYDIGGNQKNEYTALVYGDGDGDGLVSPADMVLVKKYIVNQSTAQDIYSKALDTDRAGDDVMVINAEDITAVKKSMLGLGEISQTPYQVVDVADYGAAGDGVTNDYAAVAAAIAAVKLMPGRKALRFDANASYLFQKTDSNTVAMDFQNIENLSVLGDNTTIILDGMLTYMNINEGSNTTVKGFNLKFQTLPYTLGRWSSVNTTAMTAVLTTQDSLGITATWTTAMGDMFGLPDISNGRMHMFFTKVEIVNALTNQYKVYFTDTNDNKSRLNSYKNTTFIMPMLDVGQINNSAFVVTHTDGLNLADINLWSASHFVFHMRYNAGDFNITNVNVVPEPGTYGKMVSWRDGFHMKDNRSKVTFDGCTIKGVHDDVFNLSNSILTVTNAISDTEFIMGCQEFGGFYYAPIHAGDQITVFNPATGAFIGTTRVAEVVAQTGPNNRIITEDALTGLAAGVTVSIDSLAQPGTVIQNCNIDGTLRFRTPVTVMNSTLRLIYSWIENEPPFEGGIPHDILFDNCTIKGVNSTNTFMSIGAVGNSGVNPQYEVSNIVFRNSAVDSRRIYIRPGAQNKVSFINCTRPAY